MTFSEKEGQREKREGGCEVDDSSASALPATLDHTQRIHPPPLFSRWLSFSKKVITYSLSFLLHFERTTSRNALLQFRSQYFSNCRNGEFHHEPVLHFQSNIVTKAPGRQGGDALRHSLPIHRADPCLVRPCSSISSPVSRSNFCCGAIVA